MGLSRATFAPPKSSCSAALRTSKVRLLRPRWWSKKVPNSTAAAGDSLISHKRHKSSATKSTKEHQQNRPDALNKTLFGSAQNLLCLLCLLCLFVANIGPHTYRAENKRRHPHL